MSIFYILKEKKATLKVLYKLFQLNYKEITLLSTDRTVFERTMKYSNTYDK